MVCWIGTPESPRGRWYLLMVRSCVGQGPEALSPAGKPEVSKFRGRAEGIEQDT